MNAVPLAGGPLASLMTDYIPSSRAQRIEEFAKNVANQLESVAGQLKTDYVKTDEFAFLFTRTFENVARDYQQEKLEAFRNILVNSLIVDVPAAIQESYLNRVENLTAIHLRVLSCFRSDADNAIILGSANQFSVGSIADTLAILIPDVPTASTATYLHDLDIQGITDGMKNTLRVMMSSQGATQLECRLTSFGTGFLKFISHR